MSPHQFAQELFSNFAWLLNCQSWYQSLRKTPLGSRTFKDPNKMMLQQNKLPDINSFLPDHSDFIFALFKIICPTK